MKVERDGTNLKSGKHLILLLIVLTLALAATGCGASAGESIASGETAAATWTEDTRISYLGPAGTYTEEATQFFFGGTGTLFPKTTVDEAIADMVSGAADYAVIPQENTLGGAVTNYVDALIAQDSAYVVGEVILPISQTLLGVPGATIADIQTVCSHAQGITQSAQWRAEHMPGAATEEMPSTAAAANYVAEQGDKTIAAIAAPAAAELYGLSVLAENVQITDANKTRFYVLAAAPLAAGANRRAVFVANCEANRIDDVIMTIHNAGLELVTIHDRPDGSALGSYRYIIETENPNGVTKKQIGKVCEHMEVRCLGSYNAVEKSATSETSAAAPQPAPVTEDLSGEWQDEISQRASMDVTRNDDGSYTLLVHWGSSATEASIWEITGTFDESGILTYEDGKYGVYTFSESGDETVSNEETTQGSFTLEDGKLRWQDSRVAENGYREGGLFAKL